MGRGAGRAPSRGPRAAPTRTTPPPPRLDASSELHLHPELDLPRGADRAGDLAGVGRGPARRVEHRGRGQTEVRMVEEVERLAPELQLRPAHGEVLEDGGVPARVPRADERVPAEVAE